MHFRLYSYGLVIVTPEHHKIYQEGGWSRQDIKRALVEAADGIIYEEGLLLVRAGGPAGLQSAAIAGWSVGERGSNPITKEVEQ